MDVREKHLFWLHGSTRKPRVQPQQRKEKLQDKASVKAVDHTASINMAYFRITNFPRPMRTCSSPANFFVLAPSTRMASPTETMSA